MADHQRAARMAKRIQAIVASAIERRIRDPRLEFVTITDAKVTGDLHDATVFYTVRGRTLDAEPDYRIAEQALNKACGPLRKIVGDELKVRFTPTLTFEVDTVLDTSAHMEALLARAKARDEELAKLKETATPAGDADPYKESAQDLDKDA